jgi:hypothetical protein
LGGEIVSPLVDREPHDSECLEITRDDWLQITGNSQG